MITFPNAKINIGLSVTEKRPDGYHNLETLFYPTKLCDVLEILINKDSHENFSWSSSGIHIDSDPQDNLCIKALNLLKKDFQLAPIKIHLHKVIPFGAGLGGGSSDAASTLVMLNKIFKLNLNQQQLLDYAVQLGADCPFFIINEPCIATGIGEVLNPYPLNLRDKFLVLVKPDISISTPEAYRGINPKKQGISLIQKLNSSIKKWKNTIINDFENSVIPNHPQIQNIKNKLYDHGAEYASMTGSGAAVFGIFDNEENIHFDDCFVWQERL